MLKKQTSQTLAGSQMDDDIVYLASAGYDHTIRFWSPHEGKFSSSIQHPHSQVNDLKITPDKILIAAASFQHVRMYNIETVSNSNPEINLEGFNNNVMSIGFQEDCKWLFSGGEDCATRVWDLRTRKNQSQRMYESDSAVNSVKLHSNQMELYIGQQQGQVNIWDVRQNNASQVVRLKQEHPSINTSVQSLSINPVDDILAAIDNNGHVHIFFPAHSLTLFRTWKAHTRYGLKCLFSPNGEYLVTSSADHTAKVWRTCDIMNYNPTAATPKERGSISRPGSLTDEDQPEVQLRSQSQDTRTSISSTSGDGAALTPYKLLTCENQRWVWDVAFSADSQFLITASSEGVVRLWHVESAEIKRAYTGHQRAVTSLAFAD